MRPPRHNRFPRAPRPGRAAAVAMWLATAASAVPAAAQHSLPSAFEADVMVGGPVIEGSDDVHIVQPGDTLWHLAERYLQDALRWPQLWSLNPQIADPHWIFPGDRVALRAGGGAAATPAGVARPSTAQVQPIRTGPSAAGKTHLARTVGFVAGQDYRPAGTIRHAREVRQYLAKHDEIYLDLDEDLRAQVGQRFTIYREDRALVHPRSGDEAGRLIKYLGSARVTDTSTSLIRAVIDDSVEEILRGDRVTTYFAPLQRVAPRTNELQLDAVVFAVYSELDLYAQNQYIFVDKGAVDGVHVGNRFQLRERGDEFYAQDGTLDRDLEDFPWEVAGEAMVVEVYEDHCLALVTHAVREFESGQSAYMPNGY